MPLFKEAFKKILIFIIGYLGISYLIRQIFCKNGVTILVYHDPKPDVFRKHIEYLAKHYNFISLNKLVDAIQNKDRSDISPKSLVITIDDGYKGNYKLLEIFKRYNIYPTIYACSHIVNTSRNFSFKKGFNNFQKLKKYDKCQRLRTLRNEIVYGQQKEYSKGQALSLEELREMSAWVDFESHTISHPELPTLNSEESYREISESKKHLERILHRSIFHFSYPKSKYLSRDREYVKRCGYKSARTVECGFNNIKTDPYRLRAHCVDDNASINLLNAQITWFYPFAKFLIYLEFKRLHFPF